MTDPAKADIEKALECADELDVDSDYYDEDELEVIRLFKFLAATCRSEKSRADHLQADLAYERALRLADYARVQAILDWLKTDKSPQEAFTAGPERQLAYAIEGLRAKQKER